MTVTAHSPEAAPVLGSYSDVKQAWGYFPVWSPDLSLVYVERPETRCMARLGSIHCSFEGGHGGLHHSEKVDVWWSDG